MRTSFLLMLSAALFGGIARPQTVPPDALLAVDTPGALWVPAAPGNFAPANRPIDEAIDMVIIHDIEGTAQAGIGIFQRAGAKVSAHYIVGGDGQIYQLVREHDVAYHAGNSSINHRSVGIETEGFAYRPGFYNATEIEAAANLVREVTRRYSIARDRQHIIGHAEVPNPNDPTRFGGISGHTDPGPYWNWNTFMALVRHDSRLVSAEIPATIRPGEVLSAAVTLQNTGDESWPANLAANPLDGLQASAPVVYLGTSSGTASSFFSLSGWVSPILAAGASADTLPGTPARFDFSLRGPRQLGQVSEKLRLSLQPTASQGQTPVYFGETLPLSLRVVPWQLDATPILVPPTSKVAPVAHWSVKLPLGGWWAVYLAPPTASRGFRTPFRYTVSGSTSEKSFLVDAKTGGKGWHFAGYYEWPQSQNGDLTLDIRLDSAPSGASAAGVGAVRLVGPFPHQNGGGNTDLPRF